MMSFNRSISLLLVFLLWLPVVAGPEATASTLEERLRALIAENGVERGFWGVYVQDLATGEVLVSMDGDKPFVPASNQKLLTSAAALEYLGVNHRFRTVLYMDGRIDGTTFRGQLILRGSGDPTFGSREVQGPDPLRAWARRLAEMGITEIRGDIIGDDSLFDGEPYAEGWDVEHVTNQASRILGVSAGALAYYDNVVQLRIRSSRPGSEPTIMTIPTDYLDIRNDLLTSNRARGIAVTPRRIIGEEALVLTGSVPRSYEGSIFMPAANPARFALHSFATYLRNEGIEISGELRTSDDLSEAPDYSDLDPLFVHFSPPLSELLRVINKSSNNFYSEQVFRALTRTGSAEAAGRRVSAYFSRAGASSGLVSIRDGSGLSRKDLITPEGLGRLLAHVRTRPYYDVFYASLPAGGEPESTLRFRLGGSSVRAKTGSLEYVRSLSGYATTADGREVSFAILANQYAAPTYRIIQTIDAMVRAINTHSVESIAAG